MGLAVDPVQQYKDLLAQVPGPLSRRGLRQVIAGPVQGADGHLNAQQRIIAVATYVASHSSLTPAEAQALVQTEFGRVAPQGSVDDAGVVDDAVDAVTTVVPAVAAKVDLSSAVMLHPAARIVFAGLFTAGAGASLWVGLYLSTQTSVSTAGLVTAAVMGVLFLLSVLILVMGFRKVTVSCSTGDSGDKEK